MLFESHLPRVRIYHQMYIAPGIRTDDAVARAMFVGYDSGQLDGVFAVVQGTATSRGSATGWDGHRGHLQVMHRGWGATRCHPSICATCIRARGLRPFSNDHHVPAPHSRPHAPSLVFPPFLGRHNHLAWYVLANKLHCPNLINLINHTNCTDCAQSCIASADLGSCSATDNSCLCQTQTYLSPLSSCLAVSCTGGDLQQAEDTLTSTCAAVVSHSSQPFDLCSDHSRGANRA